MQLVYKNNNNKHKSHDPYHDPVSVTSGLFNFAKNFRRVKRHIRDVRYVQVLWALHIIITTEGPDMDSADCAPPTAPSNV